MLTPIVTELPRLLEPVARDPFIDDPSDLRERAPEASGDSPPPRRSPDVPARARSSRMTPVTPLRAIPGGGASSSSTDRQLAAVIRAAVEGDAAALERLVERFERGLRSVTRFYRLSSWDADDVVQATWLQFIQHGRALREPDAVGGWLMTTTRRQCLRLLQQRMREVPMDDLGLGDLADAGPHHTLVDKERRDALLGALAELPPRQRDLMAMLVTKPELSYEEVSAALGMPIGSIGPTRQRSISRLQHSSRLRAVRAEA